jgi:hypothetical protein
MLCGLCRFLKHLLQVVWGESNDRSWFMWTEIHENCATAFVKAMVVLLTISVKPSTLHHVVKGGEQCQLPVLYVATANDTRVVCPVASVFIDMYVIVTAGICASWHLENVFYCTRGGEHCKIGASMFSVAREFPRE